MKPLDRLVLLTFVLALAITTARVLRVHCKPDWLCERPAGITEPTIIERSIR